VWNVKKGKKHAELGWETPNNIKYLFKRVKFACVEGDIKKYKGTDYVSQNEDLAHVAKNACNICTSSRGSSLPVLRNLRGTSRSTKV
jgi:hypothetical protein